MKYLSYSSTLPIFKQQCLWALGTVSFIAVWWLVADFSPHHLIPNPFDILIAGKETITSGELIQHILASLWRVTIGFLIAFLGSLFLWSAATVFSPIRSFLYPIIEILRPIPPIAWIPLAVFWFGIGNTPAYFIVAIGAFFPILTALFQALDMIPLVYKHIGDSFEISRFRWLFHIVLPFSRPYIFSGVRTGFGMAWMCVIAAELISSQSGLGYFIQINRLLLRMDRVILGMLIIGLIGGIFSVLFTRLEQKHSL